MFQTMKPFGNIKGEMPPNIFQSVISTTWLLPFCSLTQAEALGKFFQCKSQAWRMEVAVNMNK